MEAKERMGRDKKNEGKEKEEENKQRKGKKRDNPKYRVLIKLKF